MSNERNEQMARQLAVLNVLAREERLRTGDFEAALRQVVETVARTLGVERVSVWRFIKNRSAIRCLALYELSLHVMVTEAPAWTDGNMDRGVHHRCDAERLEVGLRQFACPAVATRVVRRHDLGGVQRAEVAGILADLQFKAGGVAMRMSPLPCLIDESGWLRYHAM